jgi:hypothetical protein
MNICTKIILFFIVVLISIVSILGYRETFVIELIKHPNVESCWQHIVNTFNWNVDNFDAGQKKVLLTMKKLNANSYEDDNKIFPGWNNSCVIPKEHLPIFNKDSGETTPWDLYNSDPQTNSQGYMRSTNLNEHPGGYVIDLTKHDEKSFQKFLDTAYQLYDKEFFDAKTVLDIEISKWSEIKNIKNQQLEDLRSKVSDNVNGYNSLMNSSSECQRDRVSLEILIKDYNSLKDIYSNIQSNVERYNSGYAKNNIQIKKMLDDYNKYSDLPEITREALAKQNL